MNLSREQKEWADLQKFMQRRRLVQLYKVEEDSESQYQQICFQLAKSKYFDWLIITCTFLNILVIGMYSEGMSASAHFNLRVCNLFFLVVFHLDCKIRMVGYGWRSYFKDNWNLFDFILLVITDLFYLIFTYLLEVPDAFKFPLVLRGLKIGKLLKYIQHYKVISVILNTYNLILPQLINIGLLFFLFVFIFGILGMNLFAHVKVLPYPDGIQP